jgi:hypothetical protein
MDILILSHLYGARTTARKGRTLLRTQLLQSSIAGRDAEVKRLLSFGGDVDQHGEAERTALPIVSACGYSEIADVIKRRYI